MSMTNKTRPEWGFKHISETDFRSIYQHGMITNIKACWEFTGADTSREWLEATNFNGDTLVLPHSWNRALKFVGYSSMPGLFELNYEGQRMAKCLKEIDMWEALNKQEREDYERLRVKFGDS
jgi:hypothetical protein